MRHHAGIGNRGAQIDRTTAYRLVRVLVLAGAIAFIGFVLAGFSGRVFPPGDSAAVLRLQAGALLIPASMLLWATGVRRLALASIALAVLAISVPATGFLRNPTGCTSSCLTLYQKNLLSKAWPRDPLADDILASGAEIVTLQEVSDHNRRFMARLFETYPHSVTCPFRPRQEVAVLTTLDVVEGSQFCLAGAGMAGLQVRLTTGSPIWVVAVHLAWPFPFEQFRQSRLIADRIEELEGPVVVAGDFNMVPWGGSVQRIRQTAGAVHLGPFRNTYGSARPLLPLPIDQVLVPEGTTGAIELRPHFGSDHLGVLARFSLPGVVE